MPADGGDCPLDGDGMVDCPSACNGVDDASYVPDASCGVGYCRDTNTPSSCAGGVETACVPGEPLAADDSNCDGVDDDCSGEADEDAVPLPSTCGQGECAATGSVTCVGGSWVDGCTPEAPASSVDGPTANGLDDDCDGAVDEEACPSTTEMFAGAGLHEIIAPEGCGSALVRLWGGGGASGDGSGGYWGSSVTGGRGGAGGYAERTFALSSSSVILLRIGGGGQGCGAPGANVDASYSGGDGSVTRSGDGTAGADGTEAGGGGATPSSGGGGGGGFFGGGGGGGGGGPAWNPFGKAGGGGAASVLFVDSLRMVAGGGGGGGGAGSTLASNGVSGGAGGSGCSTDGSSAGADGGGGGGGGMCDGTTNQPGSGPTPFVPSGVSLPAGVASGGDSKADCAAGGEGYAIVQWAP